VIRAQTPHMTTTPDTTAGTTPDTAQADPRALYSRALDWVLGLARAVRPDQLGDPTPCSELDVRGLLSHLVATVDRAAGMGRGEDARALPWQAEAAGDDWAGAYERAIESVWAVWGGPDGEALLDAVVTAPFATLPGRAAMLAYTSETLVHGWDLAVATGQPAEADPAVAAPVLAGMRRFLPAEPRGEHVPFAAPVAPRPGSGPTEQLANWCGRARP
jgi:uncharacterized protein (TIGR03086 family)